MGFLINEQVVQKAMPQIGDVRYTNRVLDESAKVPWQPQKQFYGVFCALSLPKLVFFSRPALTELGSLILKATSCVLVFVFILQL